MARCPCHKRHKPRIAVAGGPADGSFEISAGVRLWVCVRGRGDCGEPASFECFAASIPAAWPAVTWLGFYQQADRTDVVFWHPVASWLLRAD